MRKFNKEEKIDLTPSSIINLIFILFLIYDIFVLYQLNKDNCTMLSLLNVILIITLLCKKQKDKDLIIWGLLVSCFMFLYTITLNAVDIRLLITAIVIFVNVFGYLSIPLDKKR
jgi:hypothetical protein